MELERKEFMGLVIRLAQYIDSDKWNIALLYAARIAVNSGASWEEINEIIGEDGRKALTDSAGAFIHIAKEFSPNFDPNSPGFFE